MRERIADGIREDLGMDNVSDEFRRYLARTFVMVGQRGEEDWLNAVVINLFFASAVADAYCAEKEVNDVNKFESFFLHYVYKHADRDSSEYGDYVAMNPVGSEGYKRKSVFLKEKIAERSGDSLASEDVALLISLVGGILYKEDLVELGCEESFVGKVIGNAGTIAEIVNNRLQPGWVWNASVLNRLAGE